jgi:UDP-3-O-[3-hydroxymyristoyl] glucosamine N-acyltransferase
MRLSELTTFVSTVIHRDAEFRTLGLLSHDGTKMLVMFYDRRYLTQLIQNPHIECVITNPDLVDLVPERLGVALCDDPLAAFYRIHHHLLVNTDFYWKDFPSEVSPEARVHETAYVAPHNVRVGRGTVIGPRAVVLEKTLIGEDVVIGPGVILGGEGFEPKYVEGRHVNVAHAGGVRLFDRVELQAATHAARAVFNGFTDVGEDTKVDALVHIAHNARIGRRCEIAACALIAGSTTLGDEVWIGPNATVSSELVIADRAFVAIGSLVLKNVAEGERVFGVPAKPMGASWSAQEKP